MNVLVTGGAGYVGSTLTHVLLAAGHRVRVFDSLLHGGSSLLGVWTHPSFEFVLGDIRDAAAVRNALDDVDAVVHLASIVGDPACARDPESARSVNLDASFELFEQSSSAGVQRFVFASTCSNYGKMKNSNGYVDERSELCPVSLYAETKVQVENHLLRHTEIDAPDVTCLRFATVFGVSPRMRFDLTVNEFTMEMITKKRLVVFGEQFWRPYVHVRDAARAIATVLEARPEDVRGEVFNVGCTRENYRKQDLVSLIQRVAPDASVEYVHREEDPRDYRVSFEKIKRELHFSISRSVPDGIAEVATLVRNGVVQACGDASYRN